MMNATEHEIYPIINVTIEHAIYHAHKCRHLTMLTTFIGIFITMNRIYLCSVELTIKIH